MKSLEAIDEALLRSILKAHSKTPKEFLYLETGALPLRWIIAKRRISLLKHIMERREDDLLKRVFLAQKEDFVRIVEKYLKELGVIFEQATSNSMSKDQLKTLLKKMQQMIP